VKVSPRLPCAPLQRGLLSANADTGDRDELLVRQAFLVRDCRAYRGGDFVRLVSATQPNRGASCSSDHKFAGCYAASFANNGTQAVTPADLADAIAFALRFDGLKRKHDADAFMASMPLSALLSTWSGRALS
jgi:hypothetical protein